MSIHQRQQALLDPRLDDALIEKPPRFVIIATAHEPESALVNSHYGENA